jgi:3D (Asp-Asp-Asp) domain-containing protein
MEATAYAPWHGKGVDGTTAIGLRAGYGVVAVDPRVIPLRSVLYIEGYGRAIAGDTGGAIKGHRIDLGFATAREAYRFGRRPVRVYVLSTPGSRR